MIEHFSHKVTNAMEDICVSLSLKYAREYINDKSLVLGHTWLLSFHEDIISYICAESGVKEYLTFQTIPLAFFINKFYILKLIYGDLSD